MLVLAFSWILWGTGALERKGLWIDEALHVFYSQRFHPVMASVKQYNPPNFAILTSTLTKLFGYREFFVRLPAFIFGCLSVVVFIQLLVRWKLSKVVVISLAILFLFHPIFLKSFTEARPLSFGVFLFLVSCLEFFEMEKKQFPVLEIIPFAIAYTLFVWTLGLQPIIFGLALFLYCLLGARKDLRYFLPLFVVIIAIFSYLPVQWTVLKDSVFRLDELMKGDLSNLLLAYELGEFKRLFSYYLFPYLLILFFMVSFQLRSKRKTSDSLKGGIGIAGVSIYFLATGIFFPVFIGYVLNPFSPHYLFLLLPAILFVIGAFAMEVRPIQNERLARAFDLGFLAICLLIVLTKMNVPQTYNEDYFHPRLDIRSVLKDMREDSLRAGKYYFTSLCLSSSTRWCPEEVFYTDLYWKESEEKFNNGLVVYPKESHFSFQYNSFLRLLYVDRIYILFLDIRRDDRISILRNYLSDRWKKYQPNFYESKGYLGVEVSADPGVDARLILLNLYSDLEEACSLFKSDCFWLRGADFLGRAAMGDLKGAARRNEELISIFRSDHSQDQSRTGAANPHLFFQYLPNDGVLNE